MDNYTNIEINGTSYKETYHRGQYTLFRNNKAVAIVTSIGGLYIWGSREDVNKWFWSLGVKEV